MVISEMDYDPYRFFLTQKFGEVTKCSAVSSQFLWGINLPKPWGPGGVILGVGFFW